MIGEYHNEANNCDTDEDQMMKHGEPKHVLLAKMMTAVEGSKGN